MLNLEKFFFDNNSWQIYKDSYFGYFNNLLKLEELDFIVVLLFMERFYVIYLRYVFENINFLKFEIL